MTGIILYPPLCVLLREILRRQIFRKNEFISAVALFNLLTGVT